MVGVTSDGHDALHLQGQLDTGLCWCYFNGLSELALRVLTVGAARRPTRIQEWIVWRCGIFPSASDAVLYCRAHSSSDVDGGVLRLAADKVVTGSRAGQVALGHLPIIVLFELSRVMCWVPSGFAARRARRHTYIAVNNDAVHGLRAAPEPDAALCETFEVSQFVTLVEQDLPHVKFPPY